MNAWERNSSANGYMSTPIKLEQCKLLSFDDNQAQFKTKAYFLKTVYMGPLLGTWTLNQWLVPINNLKCPYTLRTELMTKTESILTEQTKLKVFPNPTMDQTTILVELPQPTNINLTLIDLNGKLIQQETKGEFPKVKHTFDLSLNDLPSGIYIIFLQTEHGISQEKLVKIK